MCLVVDTCCIAKVFNKKDSEHSDYDPVLTWIIDGRGKVIYGGTKYKDEMRKAARYFSLLVELKRQGKAIELDDNAVDTEEKNVQQREKNKDFDDPHLVAIVIVSRCRIVCTNDKRAHRFIKKASVYPKGVTKPSIYSCISNTNLLVSRNLVGVCK